METIQSKMNEQIQSQEKRTQYLTSREFNVLLARTVQRFPCIWDRSLLENRTHNVTYAAWEQVAQILGNRLAAYQCKSRWRSLRNSYTAHLRKEARTGKSRLYMNGVMEFVRPNTISGARPAAANEHDSSSDCEVVEEPADSAEAQEWLELSDDEPEVTTTTSGYYEYAEDNPDDNDYDDAPAACQHLQIDSFDGDAMFLLSMLPEMEEMNEEQKRLFKDTVQALVEDFMD